MWNGFLSRRLLPDCPLGIVSQEGEHTHTRIPRQCVGAETRGILSTFLWRSSRKAGRKGTREERDDGSIRRLELWVASQDSRGPSQAEERSEESWLGAVLETEEAQLHVPAPEGRKGSAYTDAKVEDRPWNPTRSWAVAEVSLGDGAHIPPL